SVPVAPDAQVLQEEPSPRSLLVPDVTRPRSVQKILVHGDEDEPAAGEELAEVRVAGVDVVLHLMVAVHREDERKRTLSVRVPDAAVDRKFPAAEAPVPRTDPGPEPGQAPDEPGRVDRSRSQRGLSRILR